MPDAQALDTYYKTLSDQELLQLRADGGFTAEAEQVIDAELARRNLTPDEARRRFAPAWLDQATVGTVGVLVLEGGKRIAAEVAGLDAEEDQMSVKVISADGVSRGGRRSHRTIPFHQIVSFEPQPHLMDKWPYSDPCRDGTFSGARFALMTTIFLGWIVGSFALFLFLADKPWGLQEGSIIAYTLFELFFTFARTGTRGGRDLPPYMFRCPAVEDQIPQLLWRHLGFLAALFALQTAMLAARPHLPGWWNMQDRKGGTPFDGALFFLCFGLAWAQVRSNRSLLERAHREFAA